MNVQEVSEWKGLLLDVEVKWPGSVHDGRLFVNSRINKFLLYTILYFRITYKNVVIKKKETQRLALYQGSPKEKKYKII